MVLSPGSADDPPGGVPVAIPAMVMTIVLAGCAIGPDDLPSVRPGTGDGYEVSVRFASVLSLPNGADVVADGQRIGEVTGPELTDATWRSWRESARARAFLLTPMRHPAEHPSR